MNQRALARQLSRQRGGQQLTGRGGLYLPEGVLPPREQLQMEIDRRRDYLAEELLKIYIEGLGWDPARDHKAVATILAESALAAATIIHPDLPEEAQDA